jgi:ketosteroid isomerase-like protein
MRAYIADWYEMFRDLEIVPDEIVDAGPERVIVVWHVTGTAKVSGVPTELRYAALCTIRDGKIVRGREYMTKDEALAAAANED